MYEHYWRLQSKPFENTSDGKFYYPGETHQGAMLKLRYAVESRREAALLAGAAGLGKTLLAQALMRQLPDEFSPKAHVVFPQMPPDQLVAYLTDELEGSAAAVSSLEQNIRRLRTTLVENTKNGRHAVVVLDEAQLLRDAGALETIRLLLNLEHESRPLFTLILIGQTAILPILDRKPELDERLGVKCLLRPFSMEETFGYVSHRLRAAGGEDSIFEPAAIEAAHHLSGGAPRRINRLCDLSLLVGFAEERACISAEQIEAISGELVTVAPE